MNKEREDLAESLPDWTKEDLKDVVLHGAVYSPPCAKIMAIFKHHDIQYKLIDGKKKDSEYTKIPVLMLNGHQVNDSFIMVKNLAKIIDGSELTEEQVKFEEEMTFGFMIVIEVKTIGNSKGLREVILKQPNCLPKCMCCFCCYLCCCASSIGNKIMQTNNMTKSDLDHAKYVRMIEERLGENDYLAGSEIGIQDLSLYGMLYPFAGGNTVTYLQTVFMSSQKFYDWYKRMEITVGELK